MARLNNLNGTIFDIAKAIFSRKSPPASGVLRKALAQASADGAKAEIELATLKRHLADAVLMGDEARAQARARLRIAEEKLADLSTLINTLSERLGETEAADEEARRRELYASASRQRDDVAVAIREYPSLAGRLVGMIRSIAEADRLVMEANAALPTGAPSLEFVEFSRATPGSPRRITREEIVDAWVMEGAHEPVAPELSARIEVDPHSGRGYIRQSWSAQSPGDPARGIRPQTETNVHVLRYHRRRFVRREIEDGVPADIPSSLASSIALPGFRSGDPPIWLALNDGYRPEADEILAAIGRLETERRLAIAPPPEHRRRIEFEPLPDADVEHVSKAAE